MAKVYVHIHSYSSSSFFALLTTLLLGSICLNVLLLSSLLHQQEVLAAKMIIFSTEKLNTFFLFKLHLFFSLAGVNSSFFRKKSARRRHRRRANFPPQSVSQSDMQESFFKTVFSLSVMVRSLESLDKKEMCHLKNIWKSKFLLPLIESG